MVDACKYDFYYKNAKVSDCDWLVKNKINMKMFYDDPNEFLIALWYRKHPLHIEARKVYYQFDIFKPQIYWLGTSDGQRMHKSVNILLDQSDLENQFEKYIAKPLGKKAEWPRGKSANRRITKNNIRLTDLSKKIIQNVYPMDFETFGHRR